MDVKLLGQLKTDVEKYRRYKNWYSDVVWLLDSRYSRPKLMASVLAVTSIHSTVKANWTKAGKVYSQFTAGEPFTFKGLGLIRDKLEQILAGKQFTGRKINNFRDNLVGEYDSVTVDIWMARYFGFKSVTNKRYNRIEKIIKWFADKVNLEPAELQAVLWVAVRKRNGKSGGSYLPPIKMHQNIFWKD